MGKACKMLLLGALLVSVGKPAGAQVRGTIIGPGASRLPIAVPVLQTGDTSPETRAVATSFADILSRDLVLSGHLRVLPRDSYLADAPVGDVGAIDFGQWSAIGALMLAGGEARTEGDQLVVETHLFDVYRRHALAGRRYRGGRRDIRRMAQRFADEVLAQLTGRRGPFDARIVFLSTRGGNLKEVYVMSPDGGDVRRVGAENIPNLSPSWSPDVRSLLLTSYRIGNPDLFAFDLISHQWTPLSNGPGLHLGGRWSPDGTRIAVSIEKRPGNPEIAILDRNGTQQRLLTAQGAIDVSPAWSPDGQWVAFCSDRAGVPQIYVVATEGTGLRRLTYRGTYNTSPSWSPLGDRIAYTGRVDGRFRIFTVHPDGSDVRQVTHGAGDDEDPAWAPDGRYLVFSSTRSGRAKLYVVDVDGGVPTQLTRGNGDDTSPNWSSWLE